MASYSFVVDSEFQPLSYLELLHPVVTLTQYLRELEDKYTQLDLQADKLEQLANNAVDYESYEKYKSFSDLLRYQASRLSKYGLEGRDYGNFSNLFRLYGKEIQPLIEAQAKREQLIKMLQLISLQDPTSLFDRNAGNISLLEIMANPSVAPVRHSGELLRALASNAAKNIQKELTNYTLTKTKTPGYLAFTKLHGLKDADVEAFVRNPNDPKANKVLKAIYDLVLGASGITDAWEGNALEKAGQYIGLGLWDAVGTSDVGLQEDKAYFMALQHSYDMSKLAAQHNYAMRLLRAKQAAAKLAVGNLLSQQIDLQNIPYHTRNLIGIDPNGDKFKKFKEKGYFTILKNGNLKVTPLGWEKLFGKNNTNKLSKEQLKWLSDGLKSKNKTVNLIAKRLQNAVNPKVDAEWNSFIYQLNSIGRFGEYTDRNTIRANRSQIENGLSKIYNNSGSKGNAIYTLSYVMNLGTGAQKIRDAILNQYGNDEIPTVVFKDGAYKKTGTKLTKTQLANSKVGEIEMSKFGIVMPVMYKGKDNEIHTARIQVPRNIETTAYDRTMSALKDVYDMGEIINKGQYMPKYVIDSSGRKVPVRFNKTKDLVYSNTLLDPATRRDITRSMNMRIGDAYNYAASMAQGYAPQGTKMYPYNYMDVDENQYPSELDYLQMFMSDDESE